MLEIPVRARFWPLAPSPDREACKERYGYPVNNHSEPNRKRNQLPPTKADQRSPNHRHQARFPKETAQHRPDRRFIVSVRHPHLKRAFPHRPHKPDRLEVAGRNQGAGCRYRYGQQRPVGDRQTQHSIHWNSVPPAHSSGNGITFIDQSWCARVGRTKVEASSHQGNRQKAPPRPRPRGNKFVEA